jgi:hypothetical protein
MMPVQSSNLSAVDYDPRSGQLTIAFHNGRVYAYFRVPPPAFAGLMQARSRGKYFHVHIKHRFAWRKLTP